MKTLEIKSQRLFKIISGLSLLSLFVAFASCTKSNVGNNNTKSPVVVVHGSWQGPYAWTTETAALAAEGYQVKVVELAGHGSDSTPVSNITFNGYVQQVEDTINSFNGPVILIGHSLGGAIITQTAAALPQKISKLIYIAGFIPKSGKSVLDYSALDTASLLPGVLAISADGSLAGIINPQENLPNVFCQDGTEEQTQLLFDHYRAEPLAPLATPLNYELSSYNAVVNKYYVFTTMDNAISYPFQQQMAAAAGITNTYNINSGHSPFVSKSTELTDILNKIFN